METSVGDSRLAFGMDDPVLDKQLVRFSSNVEIFPRPEGSV
jgi:hypothetical protein